MSCDGDTISITAAEKPSIEDVLLGLIPGLPKVNLHNKLLSPTQGGEDFLAPFRAAAAGRARAVHPGHRGFDPQPEHHRGRRVLDLVRQRPRHRTAVDRELVDRPAGPEGVGGDGGRHLRHVRRDPRDGRQPDRSHGAGRLPGMGFRVRRRAADRERPGMPGTAGELHGHPDLDALPRRRHRAAAAAGRDAPTRVDLRQDRARRL